MVIYPNICASLALVMSLVFSLAVFYGVHFMGQWIFFWLIYFTTQCIGIGAPHTKRHCQHATHSTSHHSFAQQSGGLACCIMANLHWSRLPTICRRQGSTLNTSAEGK